MIRLASIILLFASSHLSFGQPISSFNSLAPGTEDSDFHIPDSHTFQYIIEEGDPLTAGGVLPGNCDFSAYVPMGGSSVNGYLSINSEMIVGGVSVLDVTFNSSAKGWTVNYSQAIDFTSVGGTSRNCSGAITPWGTILSAEENLSTTDNNNDGYHDIGWIVEIDPANKVVIDKKWGMGKMKHENVAIHPNQRVYYQGADSNPGYIYKYVTDNAADFSSGTLYVYTGNKTSGGNWATIGTFPGGFNPNNTLVLSQAAGATVFIGVEDIEYNPMDGNLYFAVKGEGRVYKFTDINPLTNAGVSGFTTYVGGMSYPISHANGTTMEPWANGNDNLAFDNLGNLWVNQDGGKNYIWVVENGHTQSNPKVKIFGRVPAGSESTGITFTPDFKYMFMSLQHPSAANAVSSQPDAFQMPRKFDKDVTLVIALKGNLGNCHSELVLPQVPLAPQLYKAVNVIESTGVVAVGTDVTFKAGACVELKPNFEVQNGADFLAEIENCIVTYP